MLALNRKTRILRAVSRAAFPPQAAGRAAEHFAPNWQGSNVSKEAQPEATAKPLTGWRAKLNPAALWLRRHWIGSLLVLSLSIHGLGYWYAKAYLTPPKASSPEVTLGQFEYVAAPQVQGVRKARFQLHVELSETRLEQARRQLSFHQFKLRQQLEETLRDLRGTDFEDTHLAELKRLLMEIGRAHV